MAMNCRESGGQKQSLEKENTKCTGQWGTHAWRERRETQWMETGLDEILVTYLQNNRNLSPSKPQPLSFEHGNYKD